MNNLLIVFSTTVSELHTYYIYTIYIQGQVVAAFGILPSRYIEGIVLFSSYLIRGSRLNAYPHPILTISGDLDGITRITRIVDTFE